MRIAAPRSLADSLRRSRCAEPRPRAALGRRRRSARLAREDESGARHAQLRRHVLSLSEGRVETMRIVHRVKAGRVTERLQSLDGSGREFVRNNDELTCYLPDQHTVLVEPRQDHGPFLGSLPRFGADVDEFYLIESLPASRVLGRAARVIAVNPKDQFRFGYRLVAGREHRHAAQDPALRRARPGDRANPVRAPGNAGEHRRQPILRRPCIPRACAGCGRDRRASRRGGAVRVSGERACRRGFT
jgi:hypothetical protein